MKTFKQLTEQEILALAISLEEEDERVYADFSEGLRGDFPGTAKVFDGMRDEESGHRRRLLDLYRQKFGEHIPLIRRQDVKGFVQRKPIWLMRPLRLEAIRNQVSAMEEETRRFYEKSAANTRDAGIRQLLDDLAQEERSHAFRAAQLEEERGKTESVGDTDQAKRKLHILQIIQPGLVGLIDGSVSTLAPVFAAAFATRNTHDAFVIGLAASVGAGISMGFAEALSDDGSLSGRGSPLLRGLVCGLMTTLGGIGHTLPYLISVFNVATAIAIAVVVVELSVITWVRHRYMETPTLSAAVQVAVGGAIVLATGVLIGSW